MPRLHNNHKAVRFEGCCALIGVVSDYVPVVGLTDKRFQLERSQVDRALPSLVGKPVSASLELDEHGSERIGCITHAWTSQSEVLVQGTLWLAWSPKLILAVQAGKMGMSLELLNALYEDGCYRDFSLNGVAALRKEYAAFTKTWMRIL